MSDSISTDIDEGRPNGRVQRRAVQNERAVETKPVSKMQTISLREARPLQRDGRPARRKSYGLWHAAATPKLWHERARLHQRHAATTFQVVAYSHHVAAAIGHGAITFGMPPLTIALIQSERSRSRAAYRPALQLPPRRAAQLTSKKPRSRAPVAVSCKRLLDGGG